MSESALRRWRISGRVQGVSYRASCRQQALRLGVRGCAMNLPDGSVEVLACGTEPALQALERWLWQGPAWARVDAVEAVQAGVAECPPHGFHTA